MLLVLLGGLALNLTPCVLPMIPVNLAIIGAGAASGSRTRGFALGAAYGAGMALAYGALGVAAVLTGARFGTLNSSPWFNLGIAGLFAVLGIAMFDVVRIDLTRFQPGGAPRRGQGMAAALLLGAVAALLAGACVAPVLLSVLLFAADLHAKGSTGALLLPFLLGVGMALPWPIAGAGISWLPKPGRWMQRVKYVFGAAILAAALWYGRLGVSLALERRAGSRHEVEQSLAAGAGKDCETSLAAGLNRALAEDRRVFVDMWASWCKNCLKMERTTFRDPGVQSRLASYVRVKFRAEDVREPAVKAVLDHFKAVGLPTYVVLRPRAG
jgi:thiol:disulfide interchange protein